VTPRTSGGGRQERTPATASLEEPGADIDVFDDAHIGEFIDAVRSRKRPVADVEEGLSPPPCAISGTSRPRLGRSLRWDAEKEECVATRNEQPAALRVPEAMDL